MFGCRSVGQFFVVTAVLIYDIEAQHPQVGRDSAKVGVQASSRAIAVSMSQPRDNGDTVPILPSIDSNSTSSLALQLSLF